VECWPLTHFFLKYIKQSKWSSQVFYWFYFSSGVRTMRFSSWVWSTIQPCTSPGIRIHRVHRNDQPWTSICTKKTYYWSTSNIFHRSSTDLLWQVHFSNSKSLTKVQYFLQLSELWQYILLK
jgi:hypothetical protein